MCVGHLCMRIGECDFVMMQTFNYIKWIIMRLRWPFVFIQSAHTVNIIDLLLAINVFYRIYSIASNRTFLSWHQSYFVFHWLQSQCLYCKSCKKMIEKDSPLPWTHYDVMYTPLEGNEHSEKCQKMYVFNASQFSNDHQYECTTCIWNSSLVCESSVKNI